MKLSLSYICQLRRIMKWQATGDVAHFISYKLKQLPTWEAGATIRKILSLNYSSKEICSNFSENGLYNDEKHDLVTWNIITCFSFDTF